MNTCVSFLRASILALGAWSGFAQQVPPAPVPATQKQIDAAIDNGAKFLLASYAERIDKGDLTALERVGQSALSLYTMLKAGVAKDDPTLRKLLTSVLGAKFDHTYDATCAILALSAHGPIDDRRWIEDLARKLIGWQLEGGDWGYPEGFNDLSNTQYAALGLWIAANAGVPIEPTVWTKLANATLAYQTTEGSFGYGPAGTSRTGGTGSMTAAGVGTLAICEAQLRCSGSISASLAEKLGSSRARGIDWLARNFAVNDNPKSGAWLYYYLYGLERLGAVSGISQIGGHDWYDEGAAFLVGLQMPTGCWQKGTDLSDTCFAVLFLKRATSARRARMTGEDAAASADSDAPLRVACEGSGVAHLSIAGWNQKLARELEWPGERGRGPRVVRVEYLVDDKVCAVVLADPSRALINENYSATHVFDSSGKHRLSARALVLAPGEKQASERTLDSQVLEVEVERAQPRWAPELALEQGPNLASGAKGKVKASSHVKPKDAPLGLDCSGAAALDGNSATPWLADPKDDQRSLAITFADPPNCNVLRISAAVLPAFGPNYLSRPVELEVAINGRDKQRLSMDPDALHPMRIELEHKTLVKRIDVKILSSAASESCPLVGIGEVELFLQTSKAH